MFALKVKVCHNILGRLSHQSKLELLVQALRTKLLILRTMLESINGKVSLLVKNAGFDFGLCFGADFWILAFSFFLLKNLMLNLFLFPLCGL